MCDRKVWWWRWYDLATMVIELTSYEAFWSRSHIGDMANIHVVCSKAYNLPLECELMIWLNAIWRLHVLHVPTSMNISITNDDRTMVQLPSSIHCIWLRNLCVASDHTCITTISNEKYFIFQLWQKKSCTQSDTWALWWGFKFLQCFSLRFHHPTVINIYRQVNILKN